MLVQWIFNWKITKFDIGGITDWMKFIWVLISGKNNNKYKNMNDNNTVNKLNNDHNILAVNVNSEIVDLNKEEIKNMLVNSRIQERLKHKNDTKRDKNEEIKEEKGTAKYKDKEQKEKEETIQKIKNNNEDIKTSSSSLFSQKNCELVNRKTSNKILNTDMDSESESETMNSTLFSKTTITSATTTTRELSHLNPSLVKKTNHFDELGNN